MCSEVVAQNQFECQTNEKWVRNKSIHLFEYFFFSSVITLLLSKTYITNAFDYKTSRLRWDEPIVRGLVFNELHIEISFLIKLNGISCLTDFIVVFLFIRSVFSNSYL